MTVVKLLMMVIFITREGHGGGDFRAPSTPNLQKEIAMVKFRPILPTSDCSGQAQCQVQCQASKSVDEKMVKVESGK